VNQLEGKRVWLTRSDEGNRAWQASVLVSGAKPISLVCLRFQFLTQHADRAQSQLSGADWVVFSSPRGVQAFAALGLALDPGQRIACVGQATAEACSIMPKQPELIAEDACAAGMAEELLSMEGWQSAALIGAEDPRTELGDLLRAAGKGVGSCPVYTTIPVTDGLEQVTFEPGDAVFLASPSALRALQGRCELSPNAVLISIGPSTSEAIRAAGLTVAAESSTRTVQGMLAALAQINQPAP
jgi:uroporphyrinogen-III synthase